MAINYEDERFNKVETEKNNAINEVNKTYDDMINQSNQFYQQQIDAQKQYAQTQTDLQKQSTNLQIEKVNQQKDQLQKDYEKEQKASYNDYQKQVNNYGVNAEKMASQGLSNTGYSESSRTSAYNTYQNRYALARESYNNAILNYNNSIKEIQLANDSKLAEIAYQTLQTQLQLSLEGFQYKNSLIENKTNAINNEKDRFYARYQDVVNQINQENALAEEIRQYNERMAEEIRQYNERMAEERRQFDLNYNENVRQYNEEMAEKKRQYDTSLAEEIRQYNTNLAEEKRQYNTTLASKNNYYDLDNPTDEPKQDYELKTEYFQGSYNPDIKYGTFGNGYQPDNVDGQKLSKSGETDKINTQKLDGTRVTLTQNIWKTKDGKYYVWDGRANKYYQVEKVGKDWKTV